MKSKGLDQQLVIWFRNRKWLSTGYNGGRFYNALEIVRQQCPLVPDAVWLCSLFPLGTLWASPKAVFQQLPITDARSLVWKCNWETVIADMSYSCQRNLYEKYATEGYAFAQLGMLEVCKIRWDHSLSKADADELLKWAKLAAENGEPEAMFAYAQTCERDGLTAEERRYYHRAMVLGHGQAAFVYALGYTSILTDEYFHCLKIACKDGYTVAQKHVIDMSSPVAHQDQIKFRCGQLLSKFTDVQNGYVFEKYPLVTGSNVSKAIRFYHERADVAQQSILLWCAYVKQEHLVVKDVRRIICKLAWRMRVAWVK